MTSVHQHLQDALSDLTDALSTLHKLLPAQDPIHRLEDKGDRGCLGHRRAGAHVSSDPKKAGLCRWCYDFQRAHHRLPPASLLNRHDAGYTVTKAEVEAALTRGKPAKKQPPTRPPTRRERMSARVRSTCQKLGMRA